MESIPPKKYCTTVNKPNPMEIYLGVHVLIPRGKILEGYALNCKVIILREQDTLIHSAAAWNFSYISIIKWKNKIKNKFHQFKKLPIGKLKYSKTSSEQRYEKDNIYNKHRVGILCDLVQILQKEKRGKNINRNKS